MTPTNLTAQETESRSEKVAVAVTPSQRRAIVGLAAIRGTDMSNLLHDFSVSRIVEEFERIRQADAGAA